MPLTDTTSGLRHALRAGASLVLIPLAAVAADGDNPLTTPGAARPDFLPPAGAAFELPPVAAPSTLSPAAQASATLRFDRAVFRGNTVFPAAELEEVAAPYLGRDISAAELEEFRQKLTLLAQAA